MSKKLEYLQGIPSVDSLLNSAAIDELILAGESRNEIRDWIRRHLDDFRQSILDESEVSQFNKFQFYDELREAIAKQKKIENINSLHKVVNATGILLHTNLGRAPLAESVIQRISEVAGSCPLELDLRSGQRGIRGDQVVHQLKKLTGAEDALIVNNCAAATWLALREIAIQGEAIISRGELVEIGGSYRLPEIADSAGIKLREIGTTNRTYLHDYENAITDVSKCLLRIHRSNYVITGFTAEPDIADLVKLGHQHSLPIIDDLGSGCLYDLSEYGLNEPTIQESLHNGADLVLFSGDKLFGGPQCGIILGKKEYLQRLKRNPLCRALRVDKLVTAALEETLKIHLSGKAFEQIPVLKMIALSLAELEERGHQIVQNLSSSSVATRLNLIESEAFIGGGSVPGQSLRSIAIQITVPSPDKFVRHLRLESPAIVARIDQGKVLLDLRTIQPSEVDLLSKCLSELPQSLWTEK